MHLQQFSKIMSPSRINPQSRLDWCGSPCYPLALVIVIGILATSFLCQIRIDTARCSQSISKAFTRSTDLSWCFMNPQFMRHLGIANRAYKYWGIVLKYRQYNAVHLRIKISTYKFHISAINTLHFKRIIALIQSWEHFVR